jgi:hypothetical protein
LSTNERLSPTRRPAVRGIATGIAIAAVAIAAAACGGSSSAAGGTTDAAKLPGIKEFGLTEEEFAAHVEETQALIAECMTKAGFEYVPVDVKTVEAAQARMRTDPGVGRREFKERYGLAVTTRFDNPVQDVGLGPNLEIMNSLPEATREAYRRTLWGEDPNADFVWTLDEEDFSSTGGCTRKAVSQVFTPKQITGAYVNPKDILIDADPRILEAHKQWRECMHDRGYEYEYDQDEIIEEYQDRLDELTEGDDPRTLTGARKEALEKLQQEEIDVALADFECQALHTVDIYRTVEIEVYGQPVSG